MTVRIIQHANNISVKSCDICVVLIKCSEIIQRKYVHVILLHNAGNKKESIVCLKVVAAIFGLV